MTRRSLSKDIAIALTFKVVALIALYMLFFYPVQKREITPAAMAAFLARNSAHPQH